MKQTKLIIKNPVRDAVVSPGFLKHILNDFFWIMTLSSPDPELVPSLGFVYG